MFKGDIVYPCVGTIGNAVVIEEDDKYSIYIKKGEALMPWKDFNKNMAVSIEYDLQW